MAPTRQADVLDSLIIGAGLSGVITLRNMLKDGRLTNVLVVDRNDRVGGLWIDHIPRYSTLQLLKCDWTMHGVTVDENEPERRASCDSICRWVQKYPDTFKLKEFIRFGVECVLIQQDARSKLWTCTLRDIATDRQWDVVSRSVCIGSGLENLPRVASLPGDATATMPIVHNLSVRSGSDLPKDEVLVVGAGPSAMDVCLEATRAGTKRTYLVSRKAHFGVPDNWPIPLGSETKLLRFLFLKLMLPAWVVNFIFHLETTLWAWWYGVPAWKPVDVVASRDIGYVMRSALLPAIKDGRLVPLITEIESINGGEVTLKNGTILHPQKIVCATGWHLDYKFIPFYRGIEFKDLQPKLFARFMDIDHDGLFFISIANGFQSATHNADIVSRAIVQILTGDWERPSDSVLHDNIDNVVLKQIALAGLYERELHNLGFVI